MLLLLRSLRAAKAEVMVVFHGHITRYVAASFGASGIAGSPPPRTAPHAALLITGTNFGTVNSRNDQLKKLFNPLINCSVGVGSSRSR